MRLLQGRTELSKCFLLTLSQQMERQQEHVAQKALMLAMRAVNHSHVADGPRYLVKTAKG